MYSHTYMHRCVCKCVRARARDVCMCVCVYTMFWYLCCPHYIIVFTLTSVPRDVSIALRSFSFAPLQHCKRKFQAVFSSLKRIVIIRKRVIGYSKRQNNNRMRTASVNINILYFTAKRHKIYICVHTYVGIISTGYISICMLFT